MQWRTRAIKRYYTWYSDRFPGTVQEPKAKLWFTKPEVFFYGKDIPGLGCSVRRFILEQAGTLLYISYPWVECICEKSRRDMLSRNGSNCWGMLTLECTRTGRFSVVLCSSHVRVLHCGTLLGAWLVTSTDSILQTARELQSYQSWELTPYFKVPLFGVTVKFLKIRLNRFKSVGIMWWSWRTRPWLSDGALRGQFYIWP